MLTRRGLGLVALAAAVALIGFAYQVEEFVLVAVAVGVALAVGEMVAATGSFLARRRVRVEIGRLPGEALVGEEIHLPVLVHGVSGGVTGLALDTAADWQVSFPGWRGGGPPRRREPPERRRPDRRRGALARLTAPPTLRRLPGIGRGSRCETAVPVPTTRRGMWTAEPLRLWCTDPLGLVALPVTSGPPAQVVVCPDPALSVRSALSPPPPGLRHGTGDGDVGGRQAGGEELEGLRPYVPGDRLSRLHWPSMARGGDLLVRHFSEAQEVELELLVDVRPANLERSVQSAASRGVAAAEAGEVVVVRTTAGETLTVPAGASARRTLLQALGVIGPATRR